MKSQARSTLSLGPPSARVKNVAAGEYVYARLFGTGCIGSCLSNPRTLLLQRAGVKSQVVAFCKTAVTQSLHLPNGELRRTKTVPTFVQSFRAHLQPISTSHLTLAFKP